MDTIKRYEPSFSLNGTALIEEVGGRAAMLEDYLQVEQQRDQLLAERSRLTSTTPANEPRAVDRFEPALDSAGRYFNKNPKGRVVMYRALEAVQAQCEQLMAEIELLKAQQSPH
jgi:hypothetical protein